MRIKSLKKASISRAATTGLLRRHPEGGHIQGAEAPGPARAHSTDRAHAPTRTQTQTRTQGLACKELSNTPGGWRGTDGKRMEARQAYGETRQAAPSGRSRRARSAEDRNEPCTHAHKRTHTHTKRQTVEKRGRAEDL